RAIRHRDVTGQCPAIAENDMIAHHAVVRDVRVGEEITVRPDPRHAAVSRCRVDGHVLAKHILGTDLQGTGPALVLQVLRLQPDTREWVELAARPDGRMPIEHDVRMKPAPVAEPDLRADDRVRPDLASVPDLGTRVHDRTGMYCRGHENAIRTTGRSAAYRS